MKYCIPAQGDCRATLAVTCTGGSGRTTTSASLHYSSRSGGPVAVKRTEEQETAMLLARDDVKAFSKTNTSKNMERGGCVYIMTNTHHTTLYVGVTSDLVSRVLQHKEKTDVKSFTARYNLEKLVYYEVFPRIEEAITREKQLKSGSRKKKEILIVSMNPNWKDLWEEIKHW